MIKFLNILKEAKQVGMLYHYTENWLLEKIISDNTLEAPISFTRHQNDWVRDFTGGEAIIVIDGNKLSNNYKIRPYQDRGHIHTNPETGKREYEHEYVNDEFEERVDKNITNLNKYIIKIIFLTPDIKLESLLKEKNIPYEIK
jgi:hypothetical protein